MLHVFVPTVMVTVHTCALRGQKRKQPISFGRLIPTKRVVQLGLCGMHHVSCVFGDFFWFILIILIYFGKNTAVSGVCFCEHFPTLQCNFKKNENLLDMFCPQYPAATSRFVGWAGRASLLLVWLLVSSRDQFFLLRSCVFGPGVVGNCEAGRRQVDW